MHDFIKVQLWIFDISKNGSPYLSLSSLSLTSPPLLSHPSLILRICMSLLVILKLLETFLRNIRDFKINKYIYIYIYISEMRYYVHYLHFSDYYPHLCHHVYHNILVVVRSGLLQVVRMLNLALYFTHWGRLF